MCAEMSERDRPVVSADRKKEPKKLGKKDGLKLLEQNLKEETEGTLRRRERQDNQKMTFVLKLQPEIVRVQPERRIMEIIRWKEE